MGGFYDQAEAFYDQAEALEPADVSDLAAEQPSSECCHCEAKPRGKQQNAGLGARGVDEEEMREFLSKETLPCFKDIAAVSPLPSTAVLST